MTKDLSTALSLLTSNKIQVKAEVLYGIDGERELQCLWVHWSPITATTGGTTIESIIGSGYELDYFPNNAEWRITPKK